MSFAEAAIKSARIYHKYLEDNGKGESVCGVYSIEENGNSFILYLKSHLQFPDDVSLRINNIKYTRNQFLPYEYNRDKKTIKISAQSDCKIILRSTSPEEVFIVSDLKFLITNLMSWYQNYGEAISLPKSSNFLRYSPCQSLPSPSQEQINAINSALSEPFTYIWGAPGTGKTQFVLARCILEYINSDKKILITAPTNNALEQTLYGILEVMDAVGINCRDKVLRLGVPSANFVESYPDICENQMVAKEIEQFEKQIRAENDLLETNEHLLKRLSEVPQYIRHKTAMEQLPRIIQELFDKYELLNNVLAQIDNTELSISAEAKELENTKKAHKVISADIVAARNRLASAKNSRLAILYKGKIQQLSSFLEQAVKELDVYNNSITQRESELTALQCELNRLREEKNILSEAIKELWEKACSLSDYWPYLGNYLTNLCSSGKIVKWETIEKNISLYKKALDDKYSELEKISHINVDDVINSINRSKKLVDEYTEKIAALTEMTSEERIKKAVVIASTVDTYVLRIKKTSGFCHVFLDEAGYCPLIKAMSLFVFDCPVTFLGDHMQLPPVCEVNSSEMINEGLRPTVLWKVSALYCGDAFVLEPDLLIDYCLKPSEPSFRWMIKSELKITHRFGEKISEVLDEEIYKNGFGSTDNTDSGIYFINAPAVRDTKIRVSTNEIRCINKYIRAHPEEDIAVITPYVNQCSQIKNSLKGTDFYDKVFTVHASQGREWDVVLFSIVDTERKWFTDSFNSVSEAKKVINTAVSRAKKKLVLVCDYNYWISQKGQFIQKLLLKATEIPPNE